jgi:hypothetical protein
MSLLKRRIGRRAVGVGVAASLMVLGLQVPAQAVLALSGFTPASGPDNCVVVITGADFQGPNVDTVEFGGDPADFVIISDTEIWAANPGTSGFITVEKAATTGESVSSTTQFTDTAGAGECAPTVASFAPTCGVTGTTVTVTGTNLIRFTGTSDGTNVAGEFPGALVEFSPFVGADGVDATPTGGAETPTSVSVLQPAGAADGPISALSAAGQGFSATDYNVVTDPTQCVPVSNEHARSISLRLAKHLVARGTVTVADDTTECVAGVPVKIQRKKKGGGWKNVGSTTTNDAGKYRRAIKDKPGKYRALAPRVVLDEATGEVCLKARSPRVRHRH